MYKIIKLLVPLVLIVSLLTGCGSFEITADDIHNFVTVDSSQMGLVEFVNDRTCRVCVTEGDSHFDSDDTIQVTYTSLEGKQSVTVGDRVRVDYVYTTQVCEYLGSPLITVNRLHVG